MFRLFKSSPFLKELLLSKGSMGIFFLNVALNFTAALMEGVSYALIIAGLSIISVPDLVIPSWLPFGSLISSMSATKVLSLALLAAVVAQVFKTLISIMSAQFLVRAAQHLQINLQDKIYSKLLNLSYLTSIEHKFGYYTEVSLLAPTFLRDFVLALNQGISALTLSLSALCLLFYFSLPLTLIIFTVFATLWCLQRSLYSAIQKAAIKVADTSLELSNETTSALKGQTTIRVFGIKQLILSRLHTALCRLASDTKNVLILQSTTTPLHELITILGMSISVILSYLFFSHTHENILAVLIGFQAIAYRLAQRLGQVSFALGGIKALKGKIQILQGFFDLPDHTAEVGDKKDYLFEKEIAFCNVNFTYPSNELATIKKTNIKIKKGDVTALLGQSGAGKSTLVNMLLKLFEPSNGKICIDEVSLKEIDPAAWRESIGYVSQDTFLFNTTITENIQIGSLDSSFEEIQQAAKLAGAYSFIMGLEKGFDTIIGENGVKLSGGEKQRISLARALVRDPEILILDEATSHLDSETEAFIQESIENLRSNRTIIVIAHRLSTTANADKIYVLEDGVCLENGTHNTLLNLNGRYAQFWKLQNESFTTTPASS